MTRFRPVLRTAYFLFGLFLPREMFKTFRKICTPRAKRIGPMTKFDVLTVGNAIVDIISRCDDRFLNDNAITKGAMNLIDAERASTLYSLMGPALEASGGSAGNTAAGVANFGGKAAYFGKVAEDQARRNLPARYPRPGCLFRNETGRHLPADRPLHDLRDRRRRALDEHLSRRLRRSRSGRCGR